jgi:thiol-disulfide isomerase/thioredoxin
MLAACSAPASAPATDGDKAGPVPQNQVAAEAERVVSALAGRWLTPDTMPADAIAADGTVARDSESRPLGYTHLGKPLPAFTSTFLDGRIFSSADLAGRWTIIDVWGVWCGDCQADAPFAAALHRAVEADPDLDFLGIHTPPSRARAAEAYGKYGSVEAYFASQGYAYPTLIDTDASVRELLSIDWTPSYLLIAPDLTVWGFTTDLSVAGGEPVKDLLRQVGTLRSAWQAR